MPHHLQPITHPIIDDYDMHLRPTIEGILGHDLLDSDQSPLSKCESIENLIAELRTTKGSSDFARIYSSGRAVGSKLNRRAITHNNSNNF